MYVSSADGIVCFNGDIRADTDEDENLITLINDNQGIASTYIYDLMIYKNDLYAGTLHGFSHSSDNGKSWTNYSPSGLLAKSKKPNCKIIAIAVNDKYWYAGSDNGLFYSDDQGKKWNNISKQLPSSLINDLLIDETGRLWCATYKGLIYTDNNGQSFKTFGKTSGFYGENINCLNLTSDGDVIAGTNYGLYRKREKIPAPNDYPTKQAEYIKLEKPAHQWMARPISSEENSYIDQIHLFETNLSDNLTGYNGVIFNNPGGVEVSAVDYGTVVYTSRKTGHLVLKCDTHYKNYYVYAHYYNLKKITRWIGQKVLKRDIIGYVGNNGYANSNQLCLEVSLSMADDSNVPNEPVNPELWLTPLPGCGTIVGLVADTTGIPINNVKICGIEKTGPKETPFIFAESYSNPNAFSPEYRENFVISDVPAGNYLLWAEHNYKIYAIKVKVASYKVTQVKIVID
jgi:hypothetical protein